MNKPIYVVGGSKGGVGKSMVSMGLTHFLIQSGEKVFLIDADTSNPDVFKSYNDEVDSEIVNLDDVADLKPKIGISRGPRGASRPSGPLGRENQGTR